MGKGKGGGQKSPYEEELASMFAAQNMMNMAARNPNAATLFRPGSKLGDSYSELFGTSNLPAQQEFRLPDLGIASDAMRRVYGSSGVPGQFSPSIQQPMQQETAFGFTRPPTINQTRNMQLPQRRGNIIQSGSTKNYSRS